MKVKHLVVVVAVLGVASLATWFAKRGPATAPTDPRVGQAVIDDATAEKIAAVHLHTTGGDVDVAKESGDANRWVVKSYHDLPADFSKLSTLVQNLRDAKIVQFASARPERLEKMELDQTTIKLSGTDGADLATLHLGKDYESGGRFLKFDDENKAYVASVSAYLDGTAKNWADTSLIAAKPEEVVGLEIGFPDDGSLKLKRENGTAPWTAEGLAKDEKLKDTEINSLVSKLTGLRFSDTADPKADDVVAARAHQRSVQLTLTTGKTYDIAMGRKPAPPAPPAPPPPAPDKDGKTPPAPAAPPKPQPGPVYVDVKSSDASEPVNAMMQRLAFQIYEWTFTSLPDKRSALIEKTPAAPAASTPATSDTEGPKASEDTQAPAPTSPAPANEDETVTPPASTPPVSSTPPDGSK